MSWRYGMGSWGSIWEGAVGWSSGYWVGGDDTINLELSPK